MKTLLALSALALLCLVVAAHVAARAEFAPLTVGPVQVGTIVTVPELVALLFAVFVLAAIAWRRA